MITHPTTASNSTTHRYLINHGSRLGHRLDCSWFSASGLRYLYPIQINNAPKLTMKATTSNHCRHSSFFHPAPDVGIGITVVRTTASNAK